MANWLAASFLHATNLNSLVCYIIARAHLDGYSLIRFGTKLDEDGDIIAMYLACSRKGSSGAGYNRASIKCNCKFELRLAVNTMGELTYNAKNLEHNHGAHLVRRNEDGKFVLELQQRFLQEEEEQEMAEGCVKQGKGVVWARDFICQKFVTRYHQLFLDHKDEKAMAVIKEVQNSLFL
jgi:hypothetical protein